MRRLTVRGVVWICGAVAVAVLALDLSLPLGVAGGVPYALVVLVASLARRQNIVVAAALVGSALTVIGYAFSEPGGEQSAVLLNRVMALSLLWIMAAILIARERSEAKQEESENRFQHIVEASPDGIVMVDSGGRITLVNEQTVAQFGYTREELIGQPINVLIPPEFRAGHPGLQNAYMAEPYHRLIGDCEGLYGCRKNGTLFPVEIGLNPIETREGSMAMATIRDITARRRADAEHEQLAAQFEQAKKMEAIGQLAGGVAHDFNNLLTVIRGRTELLVDDVESPELRSDLAEILKATDHAASLTHQLLAFSRKQVMAPKVLDMRDIVSEVEGMVRRLIPENIELTTNLAQQVDEVRVDRNQIEQVVLNLAVNARDAMPGGGKLTIDVFNADLTEDFVLENVGSNTGPHVVLSMRDTGIGMAPETLSRIFEPFFTTKEGSRGTGLGLATVYGIVKQSGGYIRVRSEQGVGTTFEIYFPRTESESGDDTGNEVAAVSTGERRYARVLVVEDEPAVRELTRDFLIRAGHYVLEADDCAHAIKICDELTEPVDLLITDVVMPDMSGPELAEHLTSLYPGLGVLFVSGYMDEPTHDAIALDTALLTKPFTFDALMSEIEQIMVGDA